MKDAVQGDDHCVGISPGWFAATMRKLLGLSVQWKVCLTLLLAVVVGTGEWPNKQGGVLGRKLGTAGGRRGGMEIGSGRSRGLSD